MSAIRNKVRCFTEFSRVLTVFLLLQLQFYRILLGEIPIFWQAIPIFKAITMEQPQDDVEDEFDPEDEFNPEKDLP